VVSQGARVCTGEPPEAAIVIAQPGANGPMRGTQDGGEELSARHRGEFFPHRGAGAAWRCTSTGTCGPEFKLKWWLWSPRLSHTGAADGGLTRPR
jgi:hypothetical protein